MSEPLPRVEPGVAPPPTPREWAVAGGLYLLTCLSVWTTYGFFWNGGPPWRDVGAAREAGAFALGLMTIFSAHEAGHYVVARRWGVRQSLPHFIPFPMAFGTLGAIIRLRSLPPSRAALLEIGAAGPLAGFVVACGVLVLALPDTVQITSPTLTVDWPPPIPPPLAATAPGLLDQALSTWPISMMFPMFEPGAQQLLILANPGVMDLLGLLVIGEAPGRYAELSALGMAGWAGCFLTAMNLLPIGQLDGGHVVHALSPRHAPRIGQVTLALVLLSGALWGGWLVWGLLLWKLGAHRGLQVARPEPPGRRAQWTAIGAALALAGCFMLQPLKAEVWGLLDLELRTPDGAVVSADEKRAWLQAAGAPAQPAPPTGEDAP
ncbi:MAG: site-2 protease family protein [Deltaproteobacteria bacterium]|nr:site-2 protease family protein [Deltaproteobacteria bacterium]